jgi:hypothetical protein
MEYSIGLEFHQVTVPTAAVPRLLLPWLLLPWLLVPWLQLQCYIPDAAAPANASTIITLFVAATPMEGAPVATETWRGQSRPRHRENLL